MSPVVHIVGAGLAGLSTAVELSARGIAVVIYEATNQAGGRCRSYHDPALDMEIDNGNHLILSGNHATLKYLRSIGSRDRVVEASGASFPFMDLASGKRWTVRANDGPIPWWVLDSRRRVPGTGIADYFALARLLRPRQGATIGETIACKGELHDRLIGPFLLAALNTAPHEGSAALACAIMRETLVAGGRACHPVIAREGLSNALVAPALRFIGERGGRVVFGHRLRAIVREHDRATTLDFGETMVPLGAADAVILAAPPPVAAAILPGLSVPTEFRAIVNAHFRVDPPANLAPMTGVINGTVEWLFAFPHRLSVTISAADWLLGASRDELARRIWPEVARIAGLEGAMPPWQIVREARATFAATPAQDARRPGAVTELKNLWLAGDWTRTGLPATIEGAVRSGVTAARLAAP